MDDDNNNINEGRITVTLASTVLKSRVSNSAREDCWTEAATGVLIDAWGERYLALNRGNLKQQHWKEVADVVNGSKEMEGRSHKSDMQCKNRIDTVKKKYKLEKSKMSESSTSRWLFFHKLDYLIRPGSKGSNMKTSLSESHRSSSLKMNSGYIVELRSLQNNDMSETEPSRDSTDTESPKPLKKRRTRDPNSTATSSQKGKKKVEKVGMKLNSIGELTTAIMNLGEAYEHAESVKLRQVMEMEKHRLKFTKDLELQRMELFMKTQLEITQMKKDAMSKYRNTNKNNKNNHLDHTAGTL